jgi:hypothetical protein
MHAGSKKNRVQGLASTAASMEVSILFAPHRHFNVWRTWFVFHNIDDRHMIDRLKIGKIWKMINDNDNISRRMDWL